MGGEGSWGFGGGEGAKSFGLEAQHLVYPHEGAETQGTHAPTHESTKQHKLPNGIVMVRNDHTYHLC